MHIKRVQSDILDNNITIVAMAVEDPVNSIPAEYFVMAVLAYESIELPQYPRQRNSNQMTIGICRDSESAAPIAFLFLRVL